MHTMYERLIVSKKVLNNIIPVPALYFFMSKRVLGKYQHIFVFQVFIILLYFKRCSKLHLLITLYSPCKSIKLHLLFCLLLLFQKLFSEYLPDLLSLLLAEFTLFLGAHIPSLGNTPLLAMPFW